MFKYVKDAPLTYNRDRINHGKQTSEDLPALVRLNYTFNYPFLDLVNSQLKRFNWEAKTTMTVVTSVLQPDDDTVVFYRRQEHLDDTIPLWQRVTINRSNGSMQTAVVRQNKEGSEGMDQATTFVQAGDKTLAQHEVYDVLDKEMTPEMFKREIAQTIKVMKFDQFSKE